jgi:MFS family permease
LWGEDYYLQMHHLTTGQGARPLVGSVWWCIAGNVLFGTGLVFHAFLYNFYLDGLRFSATVMGYASAALTGGGLTMLLPAGRLVDRFGPKHAAVLAGAVTTAGLALGAWVERPLPVYLAAGLAGAGGGLWRVTVAPVLMRLTDARSRPRVFAWNVGSILLAGAAVIAVAGITPSWLQATVPVSPLSAVRLALLGGAAATAASIVVFAGLRLAQPAQATGESVRDQASPVDRDVVVRRFLPFVGIVALWMLGAALLGPFFNIYFARRFDLSIEHVGFVFAVAQVSWALGVWGSGELAARYGPRAMLPVTALLFAPMAWGMIAAGNLVLAAGLFLAQGLVGPITNPLIDQVLLGRVPPSLHGTLSSWRNVAADVSGIVGASAGGLLLTASGFGALFGIAGGLGLVGAVGLAGWLWLRREV